MNSTRRSTSTLGAISRWTVVALVCVIFGTSLPAQARQLGIVGRPAPPLAAKLWFNLPSGKSQLNLDDFKGKVVYLFFFQSWCPGCHSHGFPTMKSVYDHYRGDDRVAFVAVQTVFEGFWTNDADAALETIEDFKLNVPAGHDEGMDGEGSTTMRSYRSGGTPWTVIIDQAGIVRFNGFRIHDGQAVHLIEQLLSNG